MPPSRYTRAAIGCWRPLGRISIEPRLAKPSRVSRFMTASSLLSKSHTRSVPCGRAWIANFHNVFDAVIYDAFLRAALGRALRSAHRALVEHLLLGAAVGRAERSAAERVVVFDDHH